MNKFRMICGCLLLSLVFACSVRADEISDMKKQIADMQARLDQMEAQQKKVVAEEVNKDMGITGRINSKSSQHGLFLCKADRIRQIEFVPTDWNVGGIEKEISNIGWNRSFFPFCKSRLETVCDGRDIRGGYFRTE